MLLVRQMCNLALKTAQNPLDQAQGLFCASVVDNDQRLSLGWNGGSMHGMASNDINILGQVLLEGSNLGCLHRCLACDDGTDFGG